MMVLTPTSLLTGNHGHGISCSIWPTVCATIKTNAIKSLIHSSVCVLVWHLNIILSHIQDLGTLAWGPFLSFVFPFHIYVMYCCIVCIVCLVGLEPVIQFIILKLYVRLEIVWRVNNILQTLQSCLSNRGHLRRTPAWFILVCLYSDSLSLYRSCERLYTVDVWNVMTIFPYSLDVLGNLVWILHISPGDD